jgi:hypothetical protein
LFQTKRKKKVRDIRVIILANVGSGDELVTNGFSRIHGSGRMREIKFGGNDYNFRRRQYAAASINTT